MSKYLNKASAYIQKQIDELEADRTELRNQANLLNSRADELEIQISELNEVLTKIPVEKKEASGAFNLRDWSTSIEEKQPV